MNMLISARKKPNKIFRIIKYLKKQPGFEPMSNAKGMNLMIVFGLLLGLIKREIEDKQEFIAFALEPTSILYSNPCEHIQSEVKYNDKWKMDITGLEFEDDSHMMDHIFEQQVETTFKDGLYQVCNKRNLSISIESGVMPESPKDSSLSDICKVCYKKVTRSICFLSIHTNSDHHSFN